MKLEECTTKDQLIQYAEHQGYKVNHKFGEKKLREQITMMEKSKAGTSVERVERAEQPVPDDLMFVLEQETTKQETATTAPISGVPTVEVIKGGKVIEMISLAGLQTYCESHLLPYETVKNILNKSWLNHDGYSFRTV